MLLTITNIVLQKIILKNNKDIQEQGIKMSMYNIVDKTQLTSKHETTN